MSRAVDLCLNDRILSLKEPKCGGKDLPEVLAGRTFCSEYNTGVKREGVKNRGE